LVLLFLKISKCGSIFLTIKETFIRRKGLANLDREETLKGRKSSAWDWFWLCVEHVDRLCFLGLRLDILAWWEP